MSRKVVRTRSTRAVSRGDELLLRSLWTPQPLRYRLANGLTVVHRPDFAHGVVSVQIWVRAGSLHEADIPGSGISHYLEHLLFKGTRRRSGRALTEAVQARGGTMNAYTSFDRTVYHVDLPSEHFEDAVDILADMVFHAALPASEVKRERDVILREIDMYRDEPETRLYEALFETAFREHPYRFPVIGHREVFAKLDRRALLAYYRERYVPANMVLVVAGSVAPDRLRTAVDGTFGCESRRLYPRSLLVPPENPPQAPRSLELYEDVQVTSLAMAFPVPGLAHPDTPALQLLANVLGQGESSLLWGEVREKRRLVHAVSASNWNPGSTGLFFMSALCEPARRHEARDAILRICRRVAERGVPAGLLAKALRQAISAEVAVRKTAAGIAARLGAAEVVVGDLAFDEVFFRRLRAVTPAEVRETARRHLDPDRLVTVFQNPVSASPTTVSVDTTAAALPDFIEERLPNGARLLMQPDNRLPSVHFRIGLLGGGRVEPPARRGVAQLLGVMMTKDTRRRRAATLARELESMGASLTDFSGNNSLGLALECLAPDWRRAFSLFAEAVREPAFRPEAVEREREAQAAALRQDFDDIGAFGRKRLRELFFGSHPLSVESPGRLDDLARMGPADVSGLHRRLLRGRNVVFSVTGAFEPAKVRPMIRRFLAALPAGNGPVIRKKASVDGKPGDYFEELAREQAVLFVGYPGPGVCSDDFFASEVLDELFSGMASRLFDRVRERKGLAYYIHASRVLGLDEGLFYFAAGTRPDRVAAVLKEIDLEIARVAAGRIGKTELERCRTRLIAGRRMGRQSSSRRAGQAVLNALYGLPVNDESVYETRIRAVTSAMLKAFVRRWFVPARRVRLVVGPAACRGWSGAKKVRSKSLK